MYSAELPPPRNDTSCDKRSVGRGPVITVLKATPASFEHICGLFNKDSVQQALLIGGVEGLVKKFAGEDLYIFYADAQPAAVWGIKNVSALTNHYVVWFAATDIVERYKFCFFAESKKFIARAKEQGMNLVVTVNEEFTASVKWLTWLGFVKIDTSLVDTPLGQKRFFVMETK